MKNFARYLCNLFIILFFGFVMVGVGCGPEDLQRKALLELYQNNVKWRLDYKQTWASDLHYCRWAGITCNEDEQVTELWLSGNGLTTIPESIVNLTSLQIINASSNQLETLPDYIGELKNLRVLFLLENKLKLLPESIRGLTELRALDISSNQLEKLSSLEDLNLLRTLNISNNPNLQGMLSSTVCMRLITFSNINTKFSSCKK